MCFWYRPEGLKKEDFEKEEDYYAKLSQIIVYAKKFMIEEGKILVGYSKTVKIPHYFWRIVMSNPFNTHEEIDA